MIDQVAIGVAAVSLLRRQAHVSPRNDDWAEVRQVAPEPIWRYILEVDAEFCADVENFGSELSDTWLKQRHPAFADALDGLAHAVQTRAEYRLRYVQGWVLQWAEARLGMVYATERPGAGLTTSVVYDRQVQERAAFDLLGWTIAESYRHWSDPCAFLAQWRSTSVTACDRADVLERAGLFDAEVALLDA